MPTLEQPQPRTPSVYQPRAARICSATPLTELETLYELQTLDGVALGHGPGQFVQVSIEGVGECPISICTSPTRPDAFGLCVRRVGEVTSAIHRLRAGDVVGIRGPLGRGVDVSHLKGRDILIVAGGCALAPARSLIQFILDRRTQFGSFHLLYGGRSPSELLFRDELEVWTQSDQMHCHVTVDHPDEFWSGPVGVVTRLFADLPPMNPETTSAIVIGPPVMFKFVMIEVLARRIAPQHVYCSLERRMKCGIGKCGHCQVNDRYACLDGPVFTYDEILSLPEALE